jgi:site-specific recombinase XerD
MGGAEAVLRTDKVMSLEASVEAFLLDRRAMACTVKTLQTYEYALGSFLRFLAERAIADPTQISPGDIRAFPVYLQDRGLKDTTRHLHARCIKTWMFWLVEEGELESSPMRRVSMPRLEKRIPPPFSRDDVQKLLSCCDRRTALGARNFAIAVTLLDTGLRVQDRKSVV